MPRTPYLKCLDPTRSPPCNIITSESAAWAAGSQEDQSDASTAFLIRNGNVEPTPRHPSHRGRTPALHHHILVTYSHPELDISNCQHCLAVQTPTQEVMSHLRAGHWLLWGTHQIWPPVGRISTSMKLCPTSAPMAVGVMSRLMIHSICGSFEMYKLSPVFYFCIM